MKDTTYLINLVLAGLPVSGFSALLQHQDHQAAITH